VCLQLFFLVKNHFESYIWYFPYSFGNGSDVLLGENQAEVCIGLQHKVIDKNQNKYKIEYER